MGDNIKKLLAKFDEGLSFAISKQEENDKTFKSTRDSALKIADTRIGIWPSDASVKTIGDLLGYVFPISGGVKNEPTMTYPTGGMTPEGDGYQQDMKSSEEIKKAYNNLNKYYNTAAKYSLPKLKEKGGGQFWFDYYMYYLIDFYLKNAEFVKQVKTDFEGPGEMSKLMTGDGSSIKHYSNFEIFDETIVIDSKYNSNNGLHRYLIYNLASAIVKDAADDLLFQALIEAGDSYTGPYTNDIKASKKSLVELLEIIPPEEKKQDKPVVPEVKPVVPEVKPVVPTDNGVVKLKVALRGIQDGFQIRAKSDIPHFSIYAGDPDKDWPLLGVGDIPQNGEDFEDVDGAEEIDPEYIESDFADGENLLSESEFEADQLLAEEDAKRLGTGVSNQNSNTDVITNQNGKVIPESSALAKSTMFIPPGFNNTPIYGQSDTRWGSKKYDWNKSVSCGDGSTVKSSGCGPSAVSMVINHWASKGYCDPVTPDIVAKFFADFGGRVCGGGTGLSNVPKDKFKSTFGISMKVGSSEADLMTALRAGYPCVISGSKYSGYNFNGKKMTGKYPGHVVCLTGIDGEGRIRVNDSGNMPSGGKAITAFFEGKSIGQSTILNQRAIFWPSSMSAPV